MNAGSCKCILTFAGLFAAWSCSGSSSTDLGAGGTSSGGPTGAGGSIGTGSTGSGGTGFDGSLPPGGKVDITSGGVPGDVGKIFDPGTHTVVTNDPAKTPTLVYPVSDTMFPQNIYRVLFQWNRAGSTLFQVAFDSPVLKVNVYTDGAHPTCAQAGTGGACWESDQSSWSWLAAVNAGQAVTFKIRGVESATASVIYESPAYTIRFSQKAVPGAIYYWSTTAQGIRRGALGDPAPQNFLTPDEAQGKCAACHTLSRNGKRMAADVGGETLAVVDVVRTVPPPVVFGSIGTPPLKIDNSWATFNPDTSRVISSKKGVLKLLDGNTGAGIGAMGGVIPLGMGILAIQPDWAPDGQHVVFTAGSKDRGGGVGIARVSVSGDTFSGVEAIVGATSGMPMMGTMLYGYPMYNPTSDFIAFVRGLKVERDPTDQIFVTKAEPGSMPQELVRSNTLVNDTTVMTGIENNMPTWAPSPAPDTQWVAFASLRDYGFVLRKGSTYGSGKQQLWIAAIDSDKLGSGDPSFPAFRVPFTELTENCHRPFWAEDALLPPSDGGTPPPPDGGSCVPNGADCTAGRCCAGYECRPDSTGDKYICQPVIVN